MLTVADQFSLGVFRNSYDFLEVVAAQNNNFRFDVSVIGKCVSSQLEAKNQ